MAPTKDKDQIEMEGVVFDPDRCVSCNVENGHTVAHGSGGRGYGLASTPMTSGCYQWKVSFVVVVFFCLFFNCRKAKSNKLRDQNCMHK